MIFLRNVDLRFFIVENTAKVSGLRLHF